MPSTKQRRSLEMVHSYLNNMKTFIVYYTRFSQAFQADTQAEAIFIAEHTYPGLVIIKVEEFEADHEP
jgi:hypothetical protein